jgi:L-fucose isomerase-like protein
VGVRPAAFETVGYDEIAMIKKFNQNVIYRDLSDIVLRAKTISLDDPLFHSAFNGMRSEAAMVSVAEDFLEKEARMEAALTEFWRQERLSAMAMSCWPAVQSLYQFSTCSLFGRLTGQGMLTLAKPIF